MLTGSMKRTEVKIVQPKCWKQRGVGEEGD